jgi:hypothetical protein
MLDEYRSIVGNILYYTTKMSTDVKNTARESATHLYNPNKEDWKALEKCVGYIFHPEYEGLILRKPRR